MTQRFLVPNALINGVSQVFLQDLNVEGDAKKLPVELRSGFAGFTPGPGVVTITFKSAVPVSGPEFDPVAAAYGSEVYEVQVPYGAKTITSRGEFTTFSLSSSVGASTELGFAFMGKYEEPV